jgi:hypothetical protein
MKYFAITLSLLVALTTLSFAQQVTAQPPGEAGGFGSASLSVIIGPQEITSDPGNSIAMPPGPTGPTIPNVNYVFVTPPSYMSSDASQWPAMQFCGACMQATGDQATTMGNITLHTYIIGPAQWYTYGISALAPELAEEALTADIAGAGIAGAKAGARRVLKYLINDTAGKYAPKFLGHSIIIKRIDELLAKKFGTMVVPEGVASNAEKEVGASEGKAIREGMEKSMEEYSEYDNVMAEAVSSEARAMASRFADMAMARYHGFVVQFFAWEAKVLLRPDVTKH